MDLRDFDRMPPVAVAMTPFPHSVEASDPLSRVESLMEAHGVRHIPVKDAGHVVGIISERDLRALRNPSVGVDRSELLAKDVFTADPYLADLHTPLHEVLNVMADRKLGSALVVKEGRLVGIVSVTDVCRVLASILEARFGGGDDAA